MISTNDSNHLNIWGKFLVSFEVTSSSRFGVTREPRIWSHTFFNKCSGTAWNNDRQALFSSWTRERRFLTSSAKVYNRAMSYRRAWSLGIQFSTHIWRTCTEDVHHWVNVLKERSYFRWIHFVQFEERNIVSCLGKFSPDVQCIGTPCIIAQSYVPSIDGHHTVTGGF